MRLANFVTMTASMRMTPQPCFSMDQKKWFIDCILKCSVEMDCASKFQNDVIKILNPRKGQVE